ncbi:MAG: UvrD-helicase domain-containing protein [Planctomycetes bacterium]|nr:UvrD-helicase domain-containing protein [Planctomycetota bacterium]MCB9903399.1 UvrD-helicase domain-containing protein [Planctomycetota bacterium]
MVNWMDVRDTQARPSEGGPDPSRELLEGLNEPQREAVVHERGPLLILAGPGSGKTRVVTRRIAWLVQRAGVHPEEILAITFTNKAAREMRERVESLMPIRGAWISTFHSMCARILRREIEVLGKGYTRDFSIHDTADRTLLLKTLIKDCGYDVKQFRPGAVGGWISNRKNLVVEEPAALLDGTDGMEDEVLARVFARYEEAMRSSNALDFDDLLLKVLELFDEHPGVRDAYSSRFRHVMVDEYQDTNRVQYRLTKHLSSTHGNLAVCGDPDQSIYAWRGADIRNILDFEQDFGAPKIVKLEQNYRSTGNILAAANGVIRKNTGRKAKEIWSEREEGEKIAVLECGDENDEAAEIARQIRALVAEGRKPSDVAVFYRVNFMQRALETQLRLAKIPYQVVGGVEFYARREVRDLVAYLKLIVNPADDVAFRRVVNSPKRGVGDTSLERLASWAADRRVPLTRAARSSEALSEIRGRGRKGLEAFGELLGRLEGARDLPAASALELVLDEIDEGEWLRQMDDERLDERQANVDEMRTHAEEYDRLHPDAKLRGFLEDIALVSEVDGMEESTEKVTLMTLHAAKGLEFPVVFIAGVEEEILPHFRALSEGDGDTGLEEERRLFYVGMTRAQDRLFLTNAQYRLHFGQTTSTLPSRFLEEIPPELLEGFDPDAEESQALGVFEAPSEDYSALQVGLRVDHDHFGRGTIEALQGSGINARATVRFVQHGNKQLLLQYANLKVVR